MSSTRHAVVRSPNFTGLGYLPDLTPFRNEVRPIGNKAGIGGSDFGLPTMCQILKKPSWGSVMWSCVFVMVAPYWLIRFTMIGIFL